VRSFAERGIFNRAIVYFDQLLGYGRQIKKKVEHDPEIVPVENATDKPEKKIAS
jgi:hypothetical protein